MDWIIDTDMGLDDWLSLIFLAQVTRHPESNVHIKAVLTQGTGLSHALPARNNAVRLLRFAGAPSGKLPAIGVGSSNTLEGFHQYPAAWRDEEDNFRGVILPEYNKDVKRQNGSSADILRRVLRDSSDKVSILELGTFTTIAEVLTKSPKLAEKIDRIICMGGAVDVKGNIHNTQNERAEFNIWIDPVAAKKVFDLGIPITMVPLDATNQAPLTKDFLTGFQQNAAGPLADLAATWWQDSIINPVGEYYHWDLLATAIAVFPDLVTNAGEARIKVNAKIRNEIPPEKGSPFGDPNSFSALNWKGKPRAPLDPFNSGWTKRDPSGHNVNVVFQADIPHFESLITSVFDKDFGKTNDPGIPFIEPLPDL